MNEQLRRDAEAIVWQAISTMTPAYAVEKALKGRSFSGRVYLVAAGKAAWKMAETAVRTLGKTLTAGVVGGLIKTGPTGTNVNDIAVALIG